MVKLHKIKISEKQGILIQTSSVLGASIIIYPYTYSQLGYILSTIITLFMCILSAFTLYLLARCSKQTNLTKIDDLFLHVSGSFVSLTGAIIIYLSCILPLIFYLQISVDFFFNIGIFFGIIIKKTTLALVIMSLNAILCIIYMDANKLEFISILSLLSLLLIVLYIICDFIFYLNLINFKSLKSFDLNYKSLNNISFITFVFISHSSILPIVECLESLEISTKVIIISNFISTIIYILVGLLGFCVFPNTDKNYLQNIGGYTPIKIILMFFLAIVNIFSFPLMMIPARVNIITFINFAVVFRTYYKFEIFNIVMNSFVTLFIMRLFSKTYLLDSLFFLVGSLTMFVIPIYLFFMIVKDITFVEKMLSIISLLVAVFGIFMGIRCLYV